jgi:hypothetical protein
MTKLVRDIMAKLNQSEREAQKTVELMAKYPEFKRITFKLLLGDKYK